MVAVAAGSVLATPMAGVAVPGNGVDSAYDCGGGDGACGNNYDYKYSHGGCGYAGAHTYGYDYYGNCGCAHD